MFTKTNMYYKRNDIKITVKNILVGYQILNS